MTTVCKQNTKSGYMKRFGSRSAKKIEQIRRATQKRYAKRGMVVYSVY